MEQLPRIALLIILFICLFSFETLGQCSNGNNGTNNFQPFALTSQGSLCLTEFIPGNPGFFQLGGNQDNFNVSVINASGDGDLINTNFPINSTDNNPPMNTNSWMNLPVPLNTALDALRVVEIGSDRFMQLNLGTFLVNDTEIQIDALPRPAFNNGAYAQSGEVDRIFIPNNNLQDNVTAEVLGHEIGHLYLNENHAQLQNVISRESEGIYEFLADMIGFQIDSSVPGGNGNVDWIFLNRDYSSQPVLNYSDPGFGSLGSHAMATVGGHWAWQMVDSGCITFDELFTFLLFCTTENNAPEVVNYPTLREATLTHFSNQNNFDCDDECLQQMVDAWNVVGVGANYSPQTPIINANGFNVGPCSFSIQWEDQGSQQFNIQVFEIVNGNITSQIGGDHCVENQNVFNLCTSQFNTGNYRVFITPSCGANCVPMDNITPYQTDFTVPGNSIPTNFTVNATSCDLVIRTTDIGLDADDYTFLYNGTTYNSAITDMGIFRESGEIIFHIDEPFSNEENGFEVGETIDITITDGCMPENTSGPHSVMINSDIDDLLQFELHEFNDQEFVLSKCFVQPVLNVAASYDLTRFDYVRARLAEIDVNQYNNLNQAGADRSYESNESLMQTANVIGQFGPELPLLEIPPGSYPKYFAMNLDIERQLFNQLHPYANQQFCSTRYNTDLVVFQILSPPQNCTTIPTITQIDYCVEGTNIMLDFTINDQMTNISHIEYRYKFEDEIDYGPCQQAISLSVMFEDDRLISDDPNCMGGIDIQARVICNCADPICDMNWPSPAPNLLETTSNLCPPASPIDLSFTPENPDYTGIATNGNEITFDYYLAPGVHSYRAWYRTLNASDTFDPNQRIECNIPIDPCLPLGSYTFNASLPQGTVTNFCQIGRTIRFPVPDGQQAYRVYLESLCCPANSNASCDDQMNLSNCFLVADSAPSCTMDDQQQINTTVLNSTQIRITWEDQIANDSEYIITATPINCQNNLPVVIDNFIGTPNQSNTHAYTLNLLPNTTYQIVVSKNCSGVLCPGCTIDISTQSTTLDLEQIVTTEVCNNDLAEIRIPLETINSIPPSFDFFIVEDPSVTTWWDSQADEYVFEGLNVGTYTLQIEECPNRFWSVTIDEDLECSLDDIEACGTIVNADRDLGDSNQISVIANSIPHSWDSDKLIIENLKLYFFGQPNLILDIEVEFRNCEIYLDNGNEIEVIQELHLSDNTIIDRCFGTTWEGIILRQGASIYMSESSLMNVDNAITYEANVNTISIFGQSNKASHTIFGRIFGIRAIENAIADITSIDDVNIETNFPISVSALDFTISSSHIKANLQSAVFVRNAMNVVIKDHCIIESPSTTINCLSSEIITIENNSYIATSNQSGLHTAIRLNGGIGSIKFNDHISNSVNEGPAILGTGLTSCEISFNQDIIGDIDIDGVQNSNRIFHNTIISQNDGINLRESENAMLHCNNITASENAMRFESNCVNTDLFGNYLDGQVDLRSDQTTFYQEGEPGNRVQRGNCFEGSEVQASFLFPQDLTDSRFEVDESELACYLPAEGTTELFLDLFKEENTYLCFRSNPYVLSTELAACLKLKSIQELLDDPNLTQVGILRLINLLKRARNSFEVLPSCIKTFMDTTAYCGINFYKEFDEIENADLNGLLDYQIQSTLTNLYLELWRNYDASLLWNSEDEKKELFQKYESAKNRLMKIYALILRERQEVVELIDQEDFLQCQDSLAVLNRDVLVLRYRDRQFDRDQEDLISNRARLCAKRYGNVVHQYRALAASFTEEDFTSYDNCMIKASRNNIRERGISKKSTQLSIMPNPTESEFKIMSSNSKISHIEIYNFQGHKMYFKNDSSKQITINNINFESGIYLVVITLEDDSKSLKKLIIQ